MRKVVVTWFLYLPDGHARYRSWRIEVKANRLNAFLLLFSADNKVTHKELQLLRGTDKPMARFYGMVHPAPYRLSTTHQPTTWLSGCQKNLKPLNETSSTTGKDTPDELMVSFDVVSLFISIPQDHRVWPSGKYWHQVRTWAWQHDDSYRFLPKHGLHVWWEDI